MSDSDEVIAGLQQSLDRTTWCPYWRCRTERVFERDVTRSDGEIVAVSYACESCGRSHEWAMEQLQAEYSEDPDSWKEPITYPNGPPGGSA